MTQKKIIENIHDAADCPITAAIEVIGGKWKPPIIWLLLKEPMRFGDISKSMPNMALKVLSNCLKELEADGILIRTAYPEVPPKVVYSLSEKGKTLHDVMHSLSNWSREHLIKEQ